VPLLVVPLLVVPLLVVPLLVVPLLVVPLLVVPLLVVPLPAVKLAPTFSVALTVITQLSAVPEQAPVQPSNVSPDDGAALSVTVLPTGNDLEHPLDPLQSIPEGLEVTLPLPPTVTCTVSARWYQCHQREFTGCWAVVAEELGELPSESVPLPPPHPAIKLAKAHTAPNRTAVFISNISFSARSSMPKPIESRRRRGEI